MNNKSGFWTFTYRLAISFFLTYFLFGVICYTFGLNSSGYFAKNPIDLVTALHRDSGSVWVMAGPLVQLLRAFLFALVLFPIRDVFLERKRGWLYLWSLFLVFAIFAPAGEAPGSIEGVVYTNLPILFHMLYIPELVLQTLLFSWLFVAWEKGKLRKAITIPMVVVSLVLVLIIGYGLFDLLM